MATYVPDAMVIVYSVVSSESLKEAEETLQYLWRTGSMTDKAIIMVGNKTDLVRSRVVNIVGKRITIIVATIFKKNQFAFKVIEIKDHLKLANIFVD